MAQGRSQQPGPKPLQQFEKAFLEQVCKSGLVQHYPGMLCAVTSQLTAAAALLPTQEAKDEGAVARDASKPNQQGCRFSRVPAAPEFLLADCNTTATSAIMTTPLPGTKSARSIMVLLESTAAIDNIALMRDGCSTGTTGTKGTAFECPAAQTGSPKKLVLAHHVLHTGRPNLASPDDITLMCQVIQSLLQPAVKV